MTDKPHSLKKDSLGLFESVVMGVAGTAPGYSMAATTAALFAAVGIMSVASLLYSGLVMFGVTLAFMHLNRINANAGAAYVWVGDVFHPILGFLAGWSLLVSSTLFMVSGTIPAATATLALLSPQNVENPVIVTLVAAGWLLLVSAVVMKGIKPTSYLQVFSTVIEVALIAIIVIAGLFYFSKHPVNTFNWHSLSPFGFTPQEFANGALISLFFFWGWDVTLNLNEETVNAHHTSGKGALYAMFIAFFLFLGFMLAVQFALTPEEINASGTNVVLALAEKIFPSPWSYMAVIAVMLSTVGTLETTILQFTRTMFAQARNGVLHPRYAILHASWKTPWVATCFITVLGLILLFLSSFYPTVNLIIKDSVNAIGFQVAFYYSLTGLACAWLFRREGSKSLSNFITLILWPVLSAIFLIFIALYSVQVFSWTTTIYGIGGILIGIIPLLLNYLRGKRE